MSRAQDWEYLFNPATGFMEPKDTDGEFPGVFFPENPDGFVEANAFEYSADVPYNLRALIAGGGGDAKFIAYLNQMVLPFIGPGAPAGQPSDFALQVGGIKTAYATPFSWQGNEPALEIPWEYDYAGAPYETQAIVRNVSQSLFTPGPNGLPGNDDLGEMSSWLVWSDLGLYPETPGSAYLALGSPLFTHEVIDLPSGHTLTIDAPGASDSTPYVQSMTFNAQPWSEAFLPPSVLGSGGQLNVNLGTTPNQRWASAPEETPPSWSLGELPAIGSTSTAEVPSWPTGVPVHLNAQNVSGQDQTIRWVARTTSGVTVTPTSGTFTVPAQGSGGCIVMVRAAAASTTGTIRFTLQTATSQVLPQVAVEVAPATNELAIGVRSQDLGDDLGL
jgi:putative alpha-1,2-mannosidase